MIKHQQQMYVYTNYYSADLFYNTPVYVRSYVPIILYAQLATYYIGMHS